MSSCFVLFFRLTSMNASRCHASTMALALRVWPLVSTCAAVWMGGQARIVKVFHSSAMTAPVRMTASASACRTTSSASQWQTNQQKSLVLILVGLQVSGLWTDQPDKTTRICIVRTSSQWIGWPNKTKVTCFDRTWSQWADKPDWYDCKSLSRPGKWDNGTCLDSATSQWADLPEKTKVVLIGLQVSEQWTDWPDRNY